MSPSRAAGVLLLTPMSGCLSVTADVAVRVDRLIMAPGAISEGRIDVVEPVDRTVPSRGCRSGGLEIVVATHCVHRAG